MAVSLSAAGVYYFEQDVSGSRLDSFDSALWWASTMVTTINVGEEPSSVEGRVIGILLRLVGLATFGYITASIASFFIGERMNEDPKEALQLEQDETIARLADEVERLRAAVEAMSSSRSNETIENDEATRDKAA